MTTETSIRLPEEVRPIKYDLTLTPNLESFTFQGEETIHIQIMETTKNIVMHATELEISSVKLTSESAIDSLSSIKKVLETPEIIFDKEMETVAFSFDNPIPVGLYDLTIKFSGVLNDQLHGFYRSEYLDIEGKKSRLATTQFEATDARRAFPCWDEPAIKATFQVTLIVSKSLTAISNTLPENEVDSGSGMKTVRFAETPKMSTYLLAFIVGDLSSVQQMTPHGTLVRVWATRGKEEQGRYALDNAVRLLDYFNNYFGIPYPLEKLDHIAIPDFAAGAMENWGAITYRETALLFDPKNSAASAGQRIVEVISHEMAHMWFGDLVTMDWWNDLWLNESFASWMGDKAVDHLYPEWQMWTQFISQDTNTALSLDGLRNSHSIEVDVYDPSEIRELFDAISYSKGASILRMLEEFLGPEVFRQGINSYLSANQYNNARTQDLWGALEEASQQPVTSLMNSWVSQTGYPILQADITRENDQLCIHLAQQRFLYDHLIEEDSGSTLWQVPVSVVASDLSPSTSVLIIEPTGTITLDKPQSAPDLDWAKVNAGQTGFYRVNYATEEWANLQKAIEAKLLPATDRLGLQNDAYALMRSGFLPATVFLSLARSYKGEDSMPVWGDLAANLRGLESLLIDQPIFTQYQRFAGTIFDLIVNKVGWEPVAESGHLDALLRGIVLGQKGNYGDPKVIAEAQTRFASYLEDSSSLHPDIRGLVFGLVAQEGNKSTYDVFWELEKAATLHEEKMRFLLALSRFSDTNLLTETLEYSLSTTHVRSQDTVSVITAVAGNRNGRNLAWAFIKDNWAELDRRYGQGGFAIMRLVSITGVFTTHEKAEEVERFFKDHPAPSAGRTILQSLERIRLNAQWLENNLTAITHWLANE